ncbi:MAG: hypothetical protein NTX53_00465 [candidate division WOR-3 bacterium]|nr:hypothetical protein [candidate division WOR-3 bacterium]
MSTAPTVTPTDAQVELPTPIGPISAPGPVEELLPGGAIDWSGKTVRAKGTGVLDPGNMDKAQARLMAERAATVVAQRNLIEIIKDVRIDSDSRVQNFMTDYDVVYQRVDSIVKGAHPLGPAKYDSIAGTVDVELECDLYGAGGVEDALTPILAPNATGSDVNASNLSPQAREFLGRYSGLTFDGGNTGLKPALFPKIYDENGTLLLDTREYLQYAGQPGAYAVQFVGALDQVLARPEFAKQPLVLKVKEARGKLGADIVLGHGDVNKIKWLKDGFKFLMDAGRILVKLVL